MPHFVKWVCFVKKKKTPVKSENHNSVMLRYKCPPFAAVYVFLFHVFGCCLVYCFFRDVLNVQLSTVFCFSSYNMCVGCFCMHFLEKHLKTEIEWR